MTDIRATLNKIAPAVEQLACHQQQADADGVMVTVSRQAVDEVVSAINEIAISLSAAPGEPCAVKPLEWSWEPPYSVARTLGSCYSIERVHDGVRYVFALRGFIARDFDTKEAAKAAAQADYEQRIRSALVPTPQPAAGWDEAIEAAAKWHESEAPHARTIYSEMDRYSDDHEERAGWRSYKDKEDRHLAYAAHIRTLRREAPAPAEGVSLKYQNGNWDMQAARPETAEARLREALKFYADRCWDYGDRARKAFSPPSGGDEAKESEGGQEHHGRSAELIDRVATPADADPKHWPSRKDPVRVDRLAPSEPSPPADRREIVARAVAALTELTAVVRGECPSILNEDSGGDAALSIEIDEVLRLAALDGGRDA